MEKVSNYRLHCFPESGNSYKVALMLTLCGAPWDPIFVDFFGGETRTATWRGAINEMGEVPVLEHGECRMAQSGVVLGYLAEKFSRYDAREAAERRELMRWLFSLGAARPRGERRDDLWLCTMGDTKDVEASRPVRFSSAAHMTSLAERLSQPGSGFCSDTDLGHNLN
jgi:glutathione S-transferase